MSKLYNGRVKRAGGGIMDMGGMDHSKMHGGMAMDHSQHSDHAMPGALAKPSSTVGSIIKKVRNAG